MMNRASRAEKGLGTWARDTSAVRLEKPQRNLPLGKKLEGVADG